MTKTESKPVGTRELHYLENKLSGMVVTQSAKGAVIVPIVHVMDGDAYRIRARQIEKQSNREIGSKYFSNNDRLKFPRRVNGVIGK